MLLSIKCCSKLASYADERRVLEVETDVGLVDCVRLLLADDADAIAHAMLVGPEYYALELASQQGVLGTQAYPSNVAEIWPTKSSKRSKLRALRCLRRRSWL